MSVRVITDTSCDLTPHLESELQELGVITIPFTFSFGLEEYADKTIPMEEFLHKARATWPTTSVPATGVFANIFREVIDQGDHPLCITITSHHSATYSSALTASQQFEPGQVTVVDSQSLSLGQGLLVLTAARAAAEGQRPQDIVKIIDEVRQRLHLYMMVDTVEYLVRGGRASRLSGLMASLLRIRPILTLLDGELTMLDRARGRNVAKQKLLELAQSHVPAELVAVAHIACEEDARSFIPEVARHTGMPAEDISLTETGMVIATHGGPGTVGIAVIEQPQRAD